MPSGAHMANAQAATPPEAAAGRCWHRAGLGHDGRSRAFFERRSKPGGGLIADRRDRATANGGLQRREPFRIRRISFEAP